MAVIVTRDIETPLGKMRVGACEGALVFALWLTGEPKRVERIIARTAGRCGGGAVKFELLAREGKVVSVNAVPGRGFTRLIADAIPKVMG